MLCGLNYKKGVLLMVTLKVNGVSHMVDESKPIAVIMKKPHPCGGFEFLILRMGMDFKLQCVKCGHTIMVPRNKIEKNIKKLV